MLQRKQHVLLVHDFLPNIEAAKRVQALYQSQIRRQPPKTVTPLIPNGQAADLSAHLESALTGQRTFNRNKTLVEINYIRKAIVLIPPSAPGYIPKIVDKPSGQVVGLGPDLVTALTRASRLLEDGQTAQFVRSVFPLAELARLSEEDAMERHLFRISSQPEMSAAMIRDLKAAAKAKIKLNGDLAEVAVPALLAGDNERILKFELVDGNWRLFDGGKESRALQKKLVSEPAGGHTVPGIRGSIVLSYSNGSWRMIGMPASQPLF